MKTLAIIPARGGSRRFPIKNMMPLNGRPLLWWTLEAARQAKNVLHQIIVSTDDAEISYFTRWQAGDYASVLDRPAHLARDDTPSWKAVEHALFETRKSWNPDALILLQPTSPLRTAVDIQTALGMLRGTGGDAVISVTEAPSDLVYEVGHAGRMRPVNPIERHGKIVSPNGAIFAMTTEAIDRGLDWWTAVVYAYVMPPERSIDIDTTGDVDMVKALLLGAGNVSEARCAL